MTAVYFEFRLQAKPGRFDGQRVLFSGGSIGQLGAAACGEHGTAPPPAGPPPPSAPPAPPTGDAPSCASYPEFLAVSSEVSTACCGDPDANCVGGLEDLQTQHVASTHDCSVALRALSLRLRIFRLPSTCSASCAAALVLMQTACATFLAAIGMQATVRHC